MNGKDSHREVRRGKGQRILLKCCKPGCMMEATGKEVGGQKEAESDLLSLSSL